MKKFQDYNQQGGRFLRRCTIPMLLMGSLLAGCGGGGGGDTNHGSTIAPVSLKINAPADLTNVTSNPADTTTATYNNNTSGLISGVVLKRWKDNWLAQRPAGITGKLVILQVAAGEAGFVYFQPITPNPAVTNAAPTNAPVYLAASAEWVMTRNNGVISTPSLVLDGPGIDAELNKYGIDPVNDMIVIAQGAASSANVMSQGRAWLALHYWGVPTNHLALLNGSNQWQVTSGAMTAADFAAAGSTPPALPAGTYTVKSLLVDNTSLIASVGDMLSIVPSSPSGSLKGTGIFIWDARTNTQFSAGYRREANDGPAVGCGTIGVAGVTAYCNSINPTVTVYDYMTSFQNSGSRQGHPNGAMDLNFLNLLNNCNPAVAAIVGGGCTFKSPSELANYMNGGTDAVGNGLHTGYMSGTNYVETMVGAGNGYQPGDTAILWCETTFRAMITGIASSVVLGHPTRFYDGGMIEWNSLSNLPDSTGNMILPANSPWRTDVKSFFRPASNASLVATRQITNAYATNSNALIVLDKAYKTPAASSTSAPSGGAAPANPCGG
jgi:3-mercaptopyruvate sulfurtransferase SseA